MGLGGISLKVLFWSSMFVLNAEVDLMISSKLESKIISDFREFGLFYKILIDDVQHLIDNESHDIGYLMQAVEQVTFLNWTVYHRLDTVRNTSRHLIAFFSIRAFFESNE